MKKFLLIAFGLLILIQFYRPSKNKSELVSENSINNAVEVPADVKNILERSCYDCHSNNTKYTWYHEIAPMSWGVAYHINEGKKHLNFDEFATKNDRKKSHTFEEIAETVKEKEMPLKGYVIFHPETALSEEEILLVAQWARLNEEKFKQ